MCFKSSEDAQKAVDHFSAGKENASEQTTGLYVCEAKTKEQRKLELAKSAY